VAAVRELVIDTLTPEQLRVLAEAGETVGARLTTVNCAAAEAETAAGAGAGAENSTTGPDEGRDVSTST